MDLPELTGIETLLNLKPLKEGYLQKRIWKNWASRYFRLYGSSLIYWQNEKVAFILNF